MHPIIDYGENVIFLVLFFASVLALGVTLERLITYRRQAGKNSLKTISDVSEKLHSHDITGALDVVRQKDDIYGRFALFSLEHCSRGHEGLPELMEGRIINERTDLEKRLTILNTLGNNAPFIGLLGTVLGIIKAFYGLGTLGSAGAEVVMRSISSALIATAAGLFVAIPVVMANNYFSRRMKVILQNMEALSKDILAEFTHAKRRQS